MSCSGLPAYGRKMIGWVLDLLYPRDCAFCGEAAGEEAGHICEACLGRISFKRYSACEICGAESTQDEPVAFVCSNCLKRRPAYRRAFIAARYAGPVRDLMQSFKYRRGLYLLPDFVRFLHAAWITQIEPLALGIDAVVPVPMHRSKFRVRGYNQAEFLAKGLAKILGLPCLPRALSRHRTRSASQTYLKRGARLENARTAYRPSREIGAVAGKTILLLDDVMTTGATGDVCADVLLTAGAKEVYLLVLARPPFL